MSETIAYGVFAPKEQIQEMTLERRQLTEFDVEVKIMYCGICHSDKHHIDNDWKDSKYPLIPGHEIIGKVSNIGINVTKFRIGDIVAIGNMTDSCQHCEKCQKSAPQYCLNSGPTWVYNGHERLNNVGGRSLKPEGDRTYGGYSTKIVAQEDFVFKLPDNLDLPSSAPLLCAGITVYYPLKHWKIGKGHKVAVAGIGGLGHLAIKFAKALGAEAVALTTSVWKAGRVRDQLGADDFILIDNDFIDALEAKNKQENELPLTKREENLLNHDDLIYKDYFDIIICTIPTSHDPTPYLRLLKPGGSKLHILGNMNSYPGLKGLDFVFYGKDITSSNVGGLYDTQEMLQFCAQHNISADIEIVKPNQIDQAISSMVNKQAQYRYVIDLQ